VWVRRLIDFYCVGLGEVGGGLIVIQQLTCLVDSAWVQMPKLLPLLAGNAHEYGQVGRVPVHS